MNTNSLSLASASSQYAYAADSPSLSITGNMTIEAWVKLTTLAGMEIVAKWDDTATQSRSYSFTLSAAGKVFFCTSSTGANAICGSNASIAAIATGVWRHLAATYTAASGAVTYYLDGATNGSDTGLYTSLFDSVKPLLIGAQDSAAPESFFNGLVDEIRIWNVVRTTQQIADNRLTELTGSEANLQAYWKLNNGYTDATANANNLTAVNSPTFSGDVPFGGVLGGSGALLFLI